MVEKGQVLRPVEPEIRPGGMGEGKEQLAVAFVNMSDCLIKPDFPEEAGDRDPADRDDQSRIDELKLAGEERSTELALHRCWNAVAPGALLARITLGDRGDVLRTAELVLRESGPPEP